MIPLAQWDSNIVMVNGVKLHYLRRGAGQPALLLHGVSDNGACWGRTAHALADYDVILLDLRVHGLSDAPEAGYDLDTLTQDVAGVLKRLELTNILLMGHSLGACVALSLAAAQPERVDKLVLIDMPISSPLRSPDLDAAAKAKLRWDYFGWLRQLQKLAADELLESQGHALKGWSPEEKLHWAQSKAQARSVLWREAGLDISGNWQAQLSSGPRLFVRGDPSAGGRVSDAEAEQVAASIGAEHMLTIPATGHSPHREDFEGFANVLRPFLGMG